MHSKIFKKIYLSRHGILNAVVYFPNVYNEFDHWINCYQQTLYSFILFFTTNESTICNARHVLVFNFFVLYNFFPPAFQHDVSRFCI